MNNQKLIRLNNPQILLSLLLICLVIGLAAIWGMPLYSDSAFHATIIRDIQRSGKFPVNSAVGWVVPDMHPLSFEPFLTHPPLFYLANSALNLLGVEIINALSLTALIPTLLSLYFFYKLVAGFFNRQIALLSTILLTFMPMSVWLNNHRIMEPLQYLLSLAAIYYAKKYTDSQNRRFLIVSAVFAAGILYIKITSAFALVAIGVYLIIQRIKFRDLLSFALVIFLLYFPYLFFSLNSRGTISYSAPGLPLIDSQILKPWWGWEVTPAETELNAESNYSRLISRFELFDKMRRSYIQVDFFKFKFDRVLQNYNIFPISPQADIHWFSPQTTFSYFYLILFVLGLISYVRNFRSTGFHFLIIPLLAVITFYLTKAGELRYFYILNILLIVAYSLGLVEIFRVVSQNTRKFIVFFLLISLILMIRDEIAFSQQYRSSLRHNIQPPGTGLDELRSLDINQISSESKNIYTPANSDVAYYLDRRTVSDYRLYFISEASVEKYLNLYNVDALILPKFFLNENFYSHIEQKDVPNSQRFWEGSTIPLDSGFNQFINNQDKVEKFDNFYSFIVYRIKK